MPRINTLDFGATDSATAGIQEAIDALPESGGTVVLPAGTFRLRRSVRLKSRVTLRGEGAATVLTRPPEFSTPLAQDLPAQETRAVLAEVTGLMVGDEICICDDEEGGWHMRHGIIRSIQDRTLDLELLVSKPELPYLRARKAQASNRSLVQPAPPR